MQLLDIKTTLFTNKLKCINLSSVLRKIFATSLITLSSLAIFSSPAFAHVIVTPHQVGIATMQDFTINVPNEKDNPVTTVTLLIPKEVTSVTPFVANGWTITTQTDTNHNITEIDWTDGSIPVGQKEEFRFTAQVPGEVTTLAWKAYETYSDGTIVSWDINPAKMKNMSDQEQDTLAEKQNKGEYSTTNVINDFAITPTPTIEEEHTSLKANLALAASGLAIIASAVAISLLRKQKPLVLQEVKKKKRR